MTEKIKKLFALVLALVLWGGMTFMNRGSHGSVRITVDGEEYGTYSLAKDQIIQINDTNICEIKDGKAYLRLYEELY